MTGDEDQLVRCGRCNAVIDMVCEAHEPPGLEAAGRCPGCGSEGDHDFASFDATDDDTRISETVTCATCGCRWRNTFVLAVQEVVE